MIKKTITQIESMEQKAGRGVSMKMLLSPDETAHFAMRQFVIKAGSYMPLHTNTVGDEVFEAKEGDILYIPAGAAHMYETIGDVDYEFLCLVPKKEDKIDILSC